jgi:predicted transcriptional regulator
MTNRPEDFEAGDDVTEEFETPRRPFGMVVSVRIGPEESAKLIDLAEETGRTVSQVARQAIRSFLALGKQKESAEISATTDLHASLFVQAAATEVSTEASGARIKPEPITTPA